MTAENSDELAFEAATNRRYLAALALRLSRPVEVALSANEKWLGNNPRTGLSVDDLGPLVARIGLDVDDEDLGTAFYIGARWLRDFDYPVVSWDAPVAKIFYEPDGNSHELAKRVVVRRTLLERLTEIVKVYDVWEREVAPEKSPFVAKSLDVPSAPDSSERRSKRREARQPVPGPVPSTTPAKSASKVQRPSALPPLKDPEPAMERLQDGMRSVDAVKYALQAPRSAALTSVLSTLQPDQYQLVTHRGNDPLLIQGHPGTGKTIIAVHRAAYLVSPERPTAERVGRVLLLGPTDEWVLHVSDILKTLDIERRVTVKALPTWLGEISQFKHKAAGGIDGSVEDVGKFVKDVLDRAAKLCKQEQPWVTGPGARMKNLERLYEVLRSRGTKTTKLQLGKSSSPWVKTLPTFGAAIHRRRYLPLFAQASLSVLGGSPLGYDHVVVDEAQDVSGLEWEIVRAHNPSGRWTLVGDMNQRRTDFGDGSWKLLSERLSLTSAAGPVEPCVIERGYRSTQPILDFAKALLPRAERTAQSLQRDGPPPIVIPIKRAAERDPQAIYEAERLLAAYPAGTVAIITVDADIMAKALLASGWRRSEHIGDWQKEDLRVALRTPETVRGVEFDAVVVVEPGAFPRNLGRVGPLYTSLTRANRELVVVHSQALPNELRRYGRR